MRPTIRFEVFKRDGFRCRYCSRRPPAVILVVDHVVPRKHGGTDDSENLVTSCEECNQGKAARLLHEVPPPLDLKTKTERLAEQETQMAEYLHWLGAKRLREEAELQHAREEFSQVRSSTYTRNWEPGWWYWQDRQAKFFIRKLGLEEVLDAIANVDFRRDLSDSPRANAEGAWKYFCGICWRKIRALEPQLKAAEAEVSPVQPPSEHAEPIPSPTATHPEPVVICPECGALLEDNWCPRCDFVYRP